MKKILLIMSSIFLYSSECFLIISCSNEKDVLISINDSLSNSFIDYMDNNISKFNLINFNPYTESLGIFKKIKNEWLIPSLTTENFSDKQIEDAKINTSIIFTYGDNNSVIENDLNENISLFKGQIIIDFSNCNYIQGELKYNFDNRLNISQALQYFDQSEISKMTNFANIESNYPYEAIKEYMYQIINYFISKYNNDNNFKEFINTTLLNGQREGLDYFLELTKEVESITLPSDEVYDGYDYNIDLYITKIRIASLDEKPNSFMSQFFYFEQDSLIDLIIKNPLKVELSTETLKQFDGSPSSDVNYSNYDNNWIHISGVGLSTTISEFMPILNKEIKKMFNNSEDFKGSGITEESLNYSLLKALSSTDEAFWEGGYIADDNIWPDNAKLSAITKGKDFDNETGKISTEASDYIKVFNILFTETNNENITITNDPKNHKLCSFHLYVVLDDVKNA